MKAIIFCVGIITTVAAFGSSLSELQHDAIRNTVAIEFELFKEPILRSAYDNQEYLEREIIVSKSKSEKFYIEYNVNFDQYLSQKDTQDRQERLKYRLVALGVVVTSATAVYLWKRK